MPLKILTTNFIHQSDIFSLLSVTLS